MVRPTRLLHTLLLSFACCSSGSSDGRSESASGTAAPAITGTSGGAGAATSGAPAPSAGGSLAAGSNAAGGVTGNAGGVGGTAQPLDAGAAGSIGSAGTAVAGSAGSDAAGTGGTAGIDAGMAGSGGNGAADDFVEDHRADCTIPGMPDVASLPAIASLPDPFTTSSGTAVTTKAQWTCRREELGAMLEHYELGEKPRKPEQVSGSISGSTLTVTVKDKGKSIQFTATIHKPSGSGPFPAVIGYGRVNLGSALSGLAVATIDYTAADIFNASAPNQMAKDGSSYRGQGIFYDLYGSDHSAGTLVAWAWGASRIIDALIATPDAGIDPKRIAVTGCSRFGKGALVAGAFDERIALTIPQEGGSGGCSSWRGIEAMKATGQDIERLSNVAGGTNWFRTSFSRSFNDASVNKIPFDHHELAGMIAPRALLNIEQAGIAWLGPGATHINNVATREVFTALGAAEAHTYSLSAGHDHCVLPTSQNHWIQSYVKKYLLGQAGEPSAIETPTGYTFDRTKWIDWDTPTLQ